MVPAAPSNAHTDKEEKRNTEERTSNIGFLKATAY